ncbi:hypothetical protein ILUMI_12998 [Ignelater luminosus]|uniref:DDE-1 domain-containing protein n=1 Tax=Ignelater luminosus TaxID=2038154 RepID=A0A8K0GBU5_IGNLU|nr:hypothetical protein ILUMI_12998 [Ignelater luminosus]
MERAIVAVREKWDCRSLPKRSISEEIERKSYLGKELETETFNYLMIMKRSRESVDGLVFKTAYSTFVPQCETSSARASTTHLFGFLEETYDKSKIRANKVYNVDETAQSIIQSKIPYVICRKGKRQIAALTSVERGATITIIACMSATGHFVPPLVIFPRTNMAQTLMKSAPSESMQSTPFIEQTRPTEKSPVLLVVDGYYSHVRNKDVIDVTRENRVTIISVPPHSKLQPLNKTFMDPLKSYYSKEARQLMKHNNTILWSSNPGLDLASTPAIFTPASPESVSAGPALSGTFQQVNLFQLAPVPSMKKNTSN